MKKYSGSGENETKGGYLTSLKKRLNKNELEVWYEGASVGRVWELWCQSKEIYNENLEENKLPVLARLVPRNGYIFKDDNASVHQIDTRICGQISYKLSKLTCSVLRSKYNRKWVFLYQKKSPISLLAVKSKTDFNEEIRPIWTGITPTYIQSLYVTIPKWIQQVIDHFSLFESFWRSNRVWEERIRLSINKRVKKVNEF